MCRPQRRPSQFPQLPGTPRGQKALFNLPGSRQPQRYRSFAKQYSTIYRSHEISTWLRSAKRLTCYVLCMNPFGITESKASALSARMEACGIADADLDESFVRSGGPGGQHVNRTATCVVLKHVPTGMQVKMQQARSQGLNRYYARKRLCELLEAKESGGATKESKRVARIRKQKARRRRRTKRSLGENEKPPVTPGEPGADTEN